MNSRSWWKSKLDEMGWDPSEPDKTRREHLFDLAWDIAHAANKQSMDAIEFLIERGDGKTPTVLAGDPDNPLFAGGIAEAVARANGELGKDDKAGG